MKSHSSLPPEVLALVHHVELNRAGWWDKTLNRLVLASVWLANKNLNVSQISNEMNKSFGLTVGIEKLESAIEALKTDDLLVDISSGVYRIPDKARKEFERDIAEAEISETNTREHFYALMAESCPDLNALDVWDAFNKLFLIPMIRDAGAHTYRLIAGETQTENKAHAEEFLIAFGQKYQNVLKIVVANFIDPKNKDVREYITRLLHAHFCVEASGLSDNVLIKLKSSLSKPLKFRLFVDTNFLFSILGLHENPSNTSANDLKNLLGTLKNNPEVTLYVTPETIKEAKGAIGAAKAEVSGIPSAGNFSRAALRSGVSGISERFFTEQQERKGLLTAKDWFDPYLENFVPLARAAGIELFNKSLEEYHMRQDVVDNINSWMDYEKDSFPKNRRRNYEKVTHDIVLWHFVNDRRPDYVESTIDVCDWILTVDFRFIGFDRHILKTSEANIPICLHPTALIQLLQFWVPRTQQFQEVVLGGLRLPFLFQEFDAKAERLSLTIIKRISRFNGSNEIPEDTLVSVILNDGLRSRIEKGQLEEEEIKLVRDALVEEMRSRAEADKAKASELKAAIEDKSAALVKTEKEKDAKDVEIKALQKRLTEAEEKSRIADEKSRIADEKSRIADEKLSSLADEQSNLKSRLEHMEENNLQHKSSFRYLGLIALIIIISVFGGWLVGYAFHNLSGIVGQVLFSVLTGVTIFVFAHLVLEILARRYWKRLMPLWPFRVVKRFRIWLWTLLGALLVAILANSIIANIQNVKDAPPSDEQSKHSEFPVHSNSPAEKGDTP